MKVSERTLQRQIGRYEADGMDRLIDQRLAWVSHRSVDEVVELYRCEYAGRNVKHFQLTVCGEELALKTPSRITAQDWSRTLDVSAQTIAVGPEQSAGLCNTGHRKQLPACQ